MYEPPITVYLNRIKPSGWTEVESIPYTLCFVHKTQPLKVIVGYADYPEDGRRWLHFSMSAEGRLPTWDELVEAKEAFLGTDTNRISQ
jgi:hypothetical protein